MLSSTFVVQPGIKVSLPKAVTSEIQQDKKVMLTVDSEGNFFVDKKLVLKSNLKNTLKTALAKTKDKVLVVRADESTKHKYVVFALDTARSVGAKRLARAAERKGKNESTSY